MSELLSSNNLRGFAAEFIATFIFVFVGIGAVGAAIGAGITLVNPIDGAGLLILSLGHGVGFFLGIVLVARITGAHLNPAITIAAIVSGNTGLIRGITFIVAQVAGAVVASLLLDQFVWGIGGLGVHGLAVDSADGLVIELILTFVLVFAVFATAFDKRGNTNWAPLTIGLVVFVGHLVGATLTGASMNPARSFGPALVHGIWDDQWLYWVAPIIGGIAAAVFYVLVFGSNEDRDKLGTISMGTSD